MKHSTGHMAVKRNKAFIYGFTFTNRFILYLSLLPLIYANQGLSLQQISIITIIANMAIFCLEIPAGFIADRIGKKKSVLIGIIINCIGLLFIILFSKTFSSFVIWAVIQAIGISLISGADSALVFEYLKANNSAEEYHKVASNISFLSRMSVFIATLISGIVIIISFDLALIITLASKLISLLLMFLFSPHLKPDNVSTSNQKVKIKPTNIIKGLRVIKGNTMFLYYAIFGALLIEAPGILWEYKSIVLDEKLNLEIQQLAVIIAFLNLIFAFSFLLSKKMAGFLKKDKKYLSYLILPIAMLAAVIATGWMSLVFFVIYIMLNGIYSPYINFKINSNLQDDSIRATVLSIINATDRIVYAAFIGLFGILANFFGLRNIFMILASLFILIYFVLIPINVRAKAQEDEDKSVSIVNE